ncbi:MAG: glycosyltransferase family 4 protein [Rikenellaceae bacterium]|jgi:glycosyltransferase involved in cell wall biosynthesis|nr:glycosyltransferase family 4 protein [Rikenellaceae bacterium]
MRIGYDAKRLFFNRSGLGNYSRGTLELLARHCPENSYVLFSPKQGGGCGFRMTGNMSRVEPQGLMRSVPSLWRSYFMSGDIRRQNLDIFHGLSAELPADVARAGVRSVVTVHDLIFVRYPELYKPFDRAIYTKKYRRSCLDADRIIAISEQTRRDLVELWNIPDEKIEVIYQGCSPIFARRASDAEQRRVREKYSLPERFIVGVGTIEQRKNLMLSLRAMAVGRTDVDLVAVGRPTEYLDELLRFAAANGLSERFHTVTNCDFEDLPAIYQTSLASVYTSRFEGFGIPILEALNSGVPVITTSGGVFAETGGAAAFYVGPDDELRMAEAIETAVGDEVARRRAVEAGYEHAARFAGEKIAANLQRFYSSML